MSRLLALVIALCLISQAQAGRLIRGTRSGALSTTVNWVLPATMADGTAITGLVGTKIYKSQTQYDLNPTLATTVVSAVSVSTSVTGLTPGTWYFWAASYTASGTSALEYIGTATL